MTETLPRRLAELATARPAAIALQEKRYGIWHTITWAEYAGRVRDLAHGLATVGVRRGEVVGIIGGNRPEWLIAELGAHCLGAAIVGLDPESTADDIRHILDLAEVRVVVVEDQEQVDKLVSVKDRLHRLERIIYCDPRGLARERHAYLSRFGDVAEAGRRDRAGRPGWLEGEIAAGDASDPAVLCARSRALAPLTHANLLATAARLHQVDPLHAGERYVSFLPLAWIGEQFLAVACGLAHGLTIAFPEDAGTQRADLREIGPGVMLGPPAIWESLRASVQVGIAEAGWLKRRVFDWAYRVGQAVVDCRRQGHTPGPRLVAARLLADAAALAAVRDHLGLSRLERGYAGGALSPEVLRFFHAIGVNLKQLDADGWLHAGDAGHLEGGHLIVERRA